MMPRQNTHEPPPAGAIGPGTCRFLAFLALFVLALIGQGLSGSWSSEFGGHPDEAGHYVTGLMVRDYVAAGFPGHPLRYAKNYYDHYPKVALGHWPPGFYLVQTLWTLPFSPWRLSVLVLMALLTAATSFLLMFALEEETGSRRQAFAGAVLFVSMPLVKEYTGMVMTEIPVTLFILGAVLCFGRYLERERRLDALGFALFASMAILTKGTGLLLALVPPLGVILSRRYQLLRQPLFWLQALVVMVLCGPWTLFTLDLVRNGWLEGAPSWAFTRAAVPYYLAKLNQSAGWCMLLLAVYGMTVGRIMAGTASGQGFGRRAALAALLPAVLVFHFLIPCGWEARHLLPILPVLIYYAMSGIKNIGARLAGHGLSPANAGAAGVAIYLILLSANGVIIPQKRYVGFAAAAARFIPGSPEEERLLVSSDARGEGMFIAEMSMREKRPGHRILRASKALGESTWSGKEYQSRFHNIADVRQFLASNSIQYLIIDRTLPKEYLLPHHRLLEETVAGYPEQFQILAIIPFIRNGCRYDRGLLICKMN